MENIKRLRKQIYIQKNIQGQLAIRCIKYWCYCLCTVFLFVIVATAFSGDLQSVGELLGSVWSVYSTPVLVSLLILPLIVWDVLKFSHRIVGPLIRLKGEMNRLANGESVEPLRFRDNDFWHDLADQFNVLRAEHLELKVGVKDNEMEHAENPEMLTQMPV